MTDDNELLPGRVLSTVEHVPDSDKPNPWVDPLYPTDERQAGLREALEQIADASAIPDGWNPYDEWGDYNDRTDGCGGEISVDQSNMGDVHSHGYAMGQWAAAKVARAALAAQAPAQEERLDERIADDNGDELEHGTPDYPNEGEP